VKDDTDEHPLVGGFEMVAERDLAMQLTPSQLAVLRPDINRAAAVPGQTAPGMVAAVMQAARRRGFVT
jgi:hypothetical protein